MSGFSFLPAFFLSLGAAADSTHQMLQSFQIVPRFFHLQHLENISQFQGSFSTAVPLCPPAEVSPQSFKSSSRYTLRSIQVQETFPQWLFSFPRHRLSPQQPLITFVQWLVRRNLGLSPHVCELHRSFCPALDKVRLALIPFFPPNWTQVLSAHRALFQHFAPPSTP